MTQMYYSKLVHPCLSQILTVRVVNIVKIYMYMPNFNLQVIGSLNHIERKKSLRYI